MPRIALDNSAQPRAALAQLFDAVVTCYLRLSAAAASIYGAGELSGPRRTVLIALARSGPQTVARLARARAQSRQRLQPLVNALIDEGLLRYQPNPAHRQSHLVVVTARGRRAVERMLETEGALRLELRLRHGPRALAAATAVLADVSQALETQGDKLIAKQRKR